MAQPGLFASRVGRRIFLLFLLCALLPILFVATVSYHVVTSHLIRQSESRLQQQSKTFAMSVVERLLYLETDLAMVAAVIHTEDSGADSGLDTVVDRQVAEHMRSLTFAVGKNLTPLHGTTIPLPELSAPEQEFLSTGRTLIRTEPSPSSFASIQLIRAVKANELTAGLLVCVVEPEFLWGVGSRNTLPPATEVLVINHLGDTLIRSYGVPDALAEDVLEEARDASSGHTSWSFEDERFVAGYWSIPMWANYRVPRWTVVISERRSNVLASLETFTKNFPLVILLTVATVLFLSLRQIRASLVPLGRLRAGTQRIAARDFSTPVNVHSGDEFEELAAAFNEMSVTLGRQFNTLSTLADLGRSVLDAFDISAIVRTLLEHAHDVFRTDRAVLLLAGTHHSVAVRFDAYYSAESAWPTITQGPFESSTELLRSLGFAVRAVDVNRDVQQHPILAELQAERLESALLAPIIFHENTLGLLVLGARAPMHFDAELANLAAELCDHLAIALHQADLRQQIDAQQKRMAELIEHLPNGLLLLGADGRVILDNKLGRDYLPQLTNARMGDRLTELAGHKIRSLLSRDPADQPVEIVSDAPEPHQYSVSAAALGDGGTILVIRDITREREIERRLQRQERLAAVGQLAAGIAHDFNNILHSIMMAAEILILNEGLRADDQEIARGIVTQGDRGADLIRQILDFSRRSTSAPEPLDLGDELRGTVAMLSRTLGDHIVIETCVEPDCEVLADPGQIQQILTNLAVNARDAMPEGGTLAITVEPQPMGETVAWLTAETALTLWTRITVTDTGIGIAEDDLEHVFEPFFTTKQPGQGTGLGLSQVYGIVQQLNGHIECESTVDVGTTFRIYLPMYVDQGEPHDRIEDRRQPASGHGERFLVVDDNTEVLSLTVSGLERLGFQTVSTPDPRQAIEIFRRERSGIDVLLTDLVMPEMHGTTLARRLKAIRPDLVVVFMTGFPGEEHRNRDELDTADGWLKKPFTFDELGATIGAALRSRCDGSDTAWNEPV